MANLAIREEKTKETGGIPDIHALLYDWDSVGPNERHFCCLLACIFREAGRVSYFDKLSGAMPLAEKARRLLPAGVTLIGPQPGVGIPIEVPDEIRAKENSTLLLTRLPEGIRVTILEYTGELAHYRLLDELAYLQEMTQRGYEPNKAIRRLFTSLCFAAIASEYPDLMSPIVLRLAKLGGDIGRIFAKKGLAWVE